MSGSPNSLFSSQSPTFGADDEDSSLQTRSNDETPDEEPTAAHSRTTMIVSSANSLKDTLVDYVKLLQGFNGIPVEISGVLKLKVKSHETRAHVITLAASQALSNQLDVSTEQLEAEEAEDESEKVEEMSQNERKRSADDSVVDLTEEVTNSSKRMRTSGPDGDTPGEEEEAVAPEGQFERDLRAAAGASAPGANGKEGEKAPAEPKAAHAPVSLSDLQVQISKQIRWVEDCRRIADSAHDGREEKWRTTSATFHDSARKDREIHEKWMVGEMTRHGNMMNQLINDVKGLYPLLHALKWDTPGSLAGPPPLPQPLPPQVHGSVPIPRLPPQPGADKRGPGRPRKDASMTNGGPPGPIPGPVTMRPQGHVGGAGRGGGGGGFNVSTEMVSGLQHKQTAAPHLKPSTTPQHKPSATPQHRPLATPQQRRPGPAQTITTQSTAKGNTNFAQQTITTQAIPKVKTNFAPGPGLRAWKNTTVLVRPNDRSAAFGEFRPSVQSQYLATHGAPGAPPPQPVNGAAGLGEKGAFIVAKPQEDRPPEESQTSEQSRPAEESG